MIALALLLVQTNDNPVANWKCATPLVQKNALRSIDSKQLSARIADECALPQSVEKASIDTYSATLQHSLYLANELNFRLEIEGEILRIRRERNVPLRR